MSSPTLNYVVGLLARREYSEFELRCKMQEKGFSEQEIDDTLAFCQQKTGKMIAVLLKTISPFGHSGVMDLPESNKNYNN